MLTSLNGYVVLSGEGGVSVTTLHVHLHTRPDAEALAYLHDLLDADVQLTFGPDVPEGAEYEILVAGRPTREEVVASSRLRTLIIPWAGLPPSTRALMRDFPDVAVHNLHHNAIAAAEMALALLLAAAKFLVPMDRALRHADWRPRYGPNPAVRLGGKTALILGYGAIGQKVGAMCEGLGMHVVGVRRYPDPAVVGVEVHPPEALPALLPRADVLVITLPHTPETDGLIGAEALARLPSRAVLVNVARGPIVEQAALYEALRDGTLHAAGLDVWYNYPSGKDAGYGAADARAHTPPADYPFHELDNLVLSPHRAGGLHTDATERDRMEHLARLLNAAARGKTMPNRVDLELGY